MADPIPSARRVLVTGASRGIGRAIALRLGRDGFDVALNFRSATEAAEATLSELRDAGGRGALLPFDVSDRDATRAALEDDLERHGAFWGVVHNAGVTADAPLASMDAAAWDRVLTTNLDGWFNVVRPLVMPMVRLRDGGRVVTISSVSGVAGNRGQTNYAASKAGLIGATRSLALELAKRGITANTVAPGFIETDLVADLPLDEIAAQVPLKRLGRPEEVAGAVGYLCSAEAAYVTGQTLLVDGGMA